DLLLQLRVLLEHRLVVFGHVVEEGVDLVDVEAAEPPDGELLLANIERANAHGTSDVLADLGGDSIQHRDQEFLQKIQHANHDHRREVDPHLGDRQPLAHRPEHRLGHTVQEPHDRVVGIRAHPRDDRAGDDDPDVGDDDEVDEVRERDEEVVDDEHHFGPWPSSRERSVARSTALMNVVRIPPSSSAAMPAIEVPPGELTMSLSAPGCRPVSSKSFAAPSTVWVARVIAVMRSSPMRTPPSASDSITTAT